MGIFSEQISQIRGRLMHAAILDEAWEPPTPSYKAPASQVMALSQMMQLNGTHMLQLSRSIAKGNFRGARVKLRAIYRRMDAVLSQMDQLAHRAKRGR